MNAFESIVGRCLEEEGYWVRHSVKVGITKQEKRAIGSFSMPTPEIDIVALSVGRNDPCPCGSGKKHKKCRGGQAGFGE